MASTLCLIAAILAGIVALERLLHSSVSAALYPAAVALIAAALALTL